MMLNSITKSLSMLVAEVMILLIVLIMVVVMITTLEVEESVVMVLDWMIIVMFQVSFMDVNINLTKPMILVVTMSTKIKAMVRNLMIDTMTKFV